MAAGGIRAGKAYVELYAKDSKLIRGLKGAALKLKAFGASITAMGRSMMVAATMMAAPLIASAKLFSSMGDQLAKMSKRTGFSVEALSELSFAARRSGTDIEALEKSARTMQRSIYDLGRGLATARDAFAVLGLSVRDLQGLSPDEQFMLIASRLREVKDATTKAAVASQIFGARTGTALLPMLDNVEELRKEAHRLGLTISQEDAAAAEKFTDAMADLWGVVKRVSFQIGAELAPILTDLANKIAASGKRAVEWVKNNRELIVTIAKVAAGLAASGGLLIVLGSLISIAGKAILVVKGLAVAFAFLAANPVILAIAALTAGIVALHFALRKAEEPAIKLADGMKRLAAQGEAQRRVDGERIAQLDILAQKQQLTSNEMQRAEDLIKRLTNRYGDLGIRINETTGEIIGLAEAHNRMNEAMRQTAIIEAQSAYAEAKENIRKLREELEPTSRELAEHGKWWEYPRAKLLGTTARGGKRGRELRAQLEEQQRLMTEAYDKMRALERGEAGALLGAEPGLAITGGLAPDLGELEQDLDAAARMEEAATERMARARFATIDDELTRELAQAIYRWQQETEEAEKAGAEMALITAAQEAEKNAIVKRYRDERIEEEKRAAEERAAREADLDEQLARARIEATMEGAEKEAALLKLEYQQAIKEAQEAGLATEKVEELYALRARMIGGAAEAAEVAVRGTFGGMAAWGLGTGDDAKRTANASEETAKNTRRLLERGAVYT